MTRLSWRRVRAIVRKELHEYRRNGSIIVGMALLPVIFVLPPLIDLLGVPSDAASVLRHAYLLLYLLGIPALVPSVLAAYSIVGEREQLTLEPMLTTPLRREEFVLGKAIAAFLPAVVISYTVYGLAVAAIELFAAPGVAPSVIRGPEVLAQLAFTPLIACWSIWVGMLISARTRDARVAQQLSAFASFPLVICSSLVAYHAIQPTLGLTLGAGAVLLVGDRLGWRVTTAAVDPERLITGRR